MLKWLKIFSGNEGLGHWTTLLLTRASLPSIPLAMTQCGFRVILQSYFIMLHCSLVCLSYLTVAVTILNHPFLPQHTLVYTCTDTNYITQG